MQETVKQDRDKYIGGSDIPVIMNLSPFKSRFDLLLEKAGYKEDTFEGNVYTEYGNKLEPIIRDWINLDMSKGLKFKEGKHIREAEADEIIGVRIHTDGENDTTILEIKTTSQIYDKVEDYKLYLVQLLFYMVNTGKARGLLAVYQRPEDLSEEFESKRLQLFDIKLEDYTELCEEISDACEKFIEDLQKVKDNPFITEEELLPVEIADITAQIIAFESQLDYLKAIEKKIKDDKARLKDAMQAAGVKSWTTPNGYKITLIPDGEDKVEKEDYLDLDSIKRDLPELFRDESDGGYMKTRFIEKKGRSGYVKITAPKSKEG
jgi:predicted phage-related endonuclease